MLSAAWRTLRRGLLAVAAVTCVLVASTATAITAPETSCGAWPLLTLPDRIVDCKLMYTPPLTLFVRSVDDAGCPAAPFALSLSCSPALVNVQNFPRTVAPTPGAAFDQRFSFSARLPSVLSPAVQAIPCVVKVNGSTPEYGDANLVLHVVNCTCESPPRPPVLTVAPWVAAARGVIVRVRNVALPTCAAVQGVVAVNDSRVGAVSSSTLFSFTRGYNQTVAFSFNVSASAAAASSEPISAVFLAALANGAATLYEPAVL